MPRVSWAFPLAFASSSHRHRKRAKSGHIHRRTANNMAMLERNNIRTYQIPKIKPKAPDIVNGVTLGEPGKTAQQDAVALVKHAAPASVGTAAAGTGQQARQEELQASANTAQLHASKRVILDAAMAKQTNSGSAAPAPAGFSMGGAPAPGKVNIGKGRGTAPSTYRHMAHGASGQQQSAANTTLNDVGKASEDRPKRYKAVSPVAPDACAGNGKQTTASSDPEQLPIAPESQQHHEAEELPPANMPCATRGRRRTASPTAEQPCSMSGAKQHAVGNNEPALQPTAAVKGRRKTASPPADQPCNESGQQQHAEQELPASSPTRGRESAASSPTRNVEVKDINSMISVKPDEQQQAPGNASAAAAEVAHGSKQEAKQAVKRGGRPPAKAKAVLAETGSGASHAAAENGGKAVDVRTAGSRMARKAAAGSKHQQQQSPGAPGTSSTRHRPQQAPAAETAASMEIEHAGARHAAKRRVPAAASAVLCPLPCTTRAQVGKAGERGVSGLDSATGGPGSAPRQRGTAAFALPANVKQQKSEQVAPRGRRASEAVPLENKAAMLRKTSQRKRKQPERATAAGSSGTGQQQQEDEGLGDDPELTALRQEKKRLEVQKASMVEEAAKKVQMREEAATAYAEKEEELLELTKKLAARQDEIKALKTKLSEHLMAAHALACRGI